MGLLGGPKSPRPVPVINPADTQNRMNDALARRLAAGGTNADQTSGNVIAPVGAGVSARLTGMN